MIKTTLNFFERASKKDKIYSFLLLTLLLGFLSFKFVVPYTETIYTKAHAKHSVINDALQEDTAYLNAYTPYALDDITAHINDLNRTLVLLQQKSDFANKELKTLHSLAFDDTAWGNFLAFVSTAAKEHKIQLFKVDETPLDNNRTGFTKVLDISIQAQGNFKSLLLFIDTLEQAGAIVDVHDVRMQKLKSSHTLDMRIAVWGVV